MRATMVVVFVSCHEFIAILAVLPYHRNWDGPNVTHYTMQPRAHGRKEHFVNLSALRLHPRRVSYMRVTWIFIHCVGFRWC